MFSAHVRYRLATFAAVGAVALLAAWPSVASEIVGAPGDPAPTADARLPELSWEPSDSGMWHTSQTFDANDTVLLAVDWGGDPSTVVQSRTRTDGEWSDWHTYMYVPDHGPDDPDGSTGSDPAWLGDVDQLQLRTTSATPNTIKLDGVSTELTGDLDTREHANTANAYTSQPAIISRAQWGADESIRRSNGRAADELGFGVVHHTATSNSYSCADSAAIVRSIYHFHVNTRGWADIGYNALIDRCGQVFEGRYGGLENNVIGAHAGGFNNGSVGVSIIGDFRSTQPTSSSYNSLVGFLAWRLDLAQIDPRSTTFHQVTGSGTYWPVGTTVEIPTVLGHGDTRSTSCPGSRLRDRVRSGELASAIDVSGTPKFYGSVPTDVTLNVGDETTLSTRTNEPTSWIWQLFDASGDRVVLKTGSSSGSMNRINVPFDGTDPNTGRQLAGGTYDARLSASNSNSHWARPLTTTVHLADSGGSSDPVTTYELSVGTEGEGTVEVTPDIRTFDDGDLAVIEGIPADGWEFTGWSSGSTANPLSLSMTQDRTIRAQFEQTTATVTTTTDGGGQIELDPSGTTHPVGTRITATATPVVGSTFSRWGTGELSATRTFTLHENIDLSALFTERSDYTLDGPDGPVDQWLVGDWDGDGELGVGWRVGNTITLTDKSQDTTVYKYGQRDDTFLVADTNGDGRDTISVVRGNWWHVRNSHSSGPADRTFRFGDRDDTPLFGDWNGNGTATPGVRRGSRNYLSNHLSANTLDHDYWYGHVTDTPLVGDTNGDGRDTISVVRGNRWYLRHQHAGGFADTSFSYGVSTDTTTLHTVTPQTFDTPTVTRTRTDGADVHIRYEHAGGNADKTVRLR